jgi:hypothetical protein
MVESERAELNERFALLEAMIAEGRRSTERWGWVFVLWGVAYIVAMAWANLGKSMLAWPVTMLAAAVVMVVAAGRVKRGHPARSVGRAISAVWTAMGIALFVLLMGLSLSGRNEPNTSVAIFGAMLSVANGTSGILLRWKMQLACALLWLGTALAACFANETQLEVLVLAAIFFCQIVFGIYLMIIESKRQHADGEAHA